MKTIAPTKENNARAMALKKVAETKWVGNTIHDNMDKCLMAINLESNNPGHYNPIATRVSGLVGWFMVNQDGSLFCEARVIKEDERKFRIEYLTMEGWSQFEELYSQFID